MDNEFSQPKVIYKIYFSTYYKSIGSFEGFFDLASLGSLGTSAFELEFKEIESKPEDIWCFEAYLAKEPDINLITKELQKFAKEEDLKIIEPIKIDIVEDKDWVTEYQKQLKPIEIGRFFIGSSLHKNDCPKDKSPIYLEASRAFGTGGHYTTSSCIEALEYLSNHNFDKILDVGTGSGILSFAAEYIWPKAEILACDIEEIAIEIALINKDINNSKVSFFQNQGEGLKLPQKFDLIVSNILAAPLISLAEDFAKLSQGSARLILSGFLDSGMAQIVEFYGKNGFKEEKVINNNKWITLIFAKE